MSAHQSSPKLPTQQQTNATWSSVSVITGLDSSTETQVQKQSLPPGLRCKLEMWWNMMTYDELWNISLNYDEIPVLSCLRGQSVWAAQLHSDNRLACVNSPCLGQTLQQLNCLRGGPPPPREGMWNQQSLHSPWDSMRFLISNIFKVWISKLDFVSAPPLTAQDMPALKLQKATAWKRRPTWRPVELCWTWGRISEFQLKHIDDYHQLPIP